MAKANVYQATKLNSKYILPSKTDITMIFDGLREDMEMFYTRFRNAQDFSFSSFAEIWKDLKFPSVFSCRRHPNELVEFTDGIIHYGKAFLFSPQLPASIFGLYFIFAVCFKQTNKFMYSKLRLTLQELEELSVILGKMYEANHIDTQSIFKILHDSGCIHYVASPLVAGIENGYKKYFQETEEDMPSIPPKEEPIEMSMLDTLENITKLYSDMKNEIYEGKNNFFSDSDFVSKVKEQLSLLENTAGAPEPDEQTENIDKTGEQRRLLKSKAFVGKKQQATKDDKSLEESEKGVSSRAKHEKPSKKLVVLVNEPIQETEDMECTSNMDVDEELPTLD